MTREQLLAVGGRECKAPANDERGEMNDLRVLPSGSVPEGIRNPRCPVPAAAAELTWHVAWDVLRGSTPPVRPPRPSHQHTGVECGAIIVGESSTWGQWAAPVIIVRAYSPHGLKSLPKE